MMSNYILPSYEEFLHHGDLTLDRLKRLLEFDSSFLNQVNYHEESPLFILLKNEKCTFDMVLLFLEYNLNINYQNTKGDTCLFLALRLKKDESVINILLKNGANVSIRNGENQTPLCYYLYWGRECSKNVIKLLLDAKCPINTCLLHASLMHCFLDNINLDLKPFELTQDIQDILELLISTGVDLNSVDTNGSSPLCLVLQYGLGARTILLMSKGASLNACERHDSPMLCATDSTWMPRLSTDVVCLLLAKKAAMDKMSAGGTPLQWALLRADYEYKAIELLVNHSSFDVNALLENYGNLLHVAVVNLYCNLNVLKLLIDRGVRVDKKSYDGQTLMELAFKAGQNCNVLKFIFVACTSSIKFINISLLHFAFDKYKPLPWRKNLDRFILLLKCFLLENRDFQVQDLRLDHSEHLPLLRFVDQCREELQRIELRSCSPNILRVIAIQQ